MCKDYFNTTVEITAQTNVNNLEKQAYLSILSRFWVRITTIRIQKAHFVEIYSLLYLMEVIQSNTKSYNLNNQAQEGDSLIFILSIPICQNHPFLT